MRKLSKSQLKNKIDELTNYRDELNALNKRQTHIQRLFSLISVVGEGKSEDSIKQIVMSTEQIPEEFHKLPIQRKKWLKNQDNKTVDQLKIVGEEIDSAEREYHKLSLTYKGKREKRKTLIGLIVSMFVIMSGVFAFHGYSLKMADFENSTEGKLKRIREYTADVQEDKDNYIQLNEKNHIQWEEGENTVVEFFLDWLHKDDISEKYGDSDDEDGGWIDAGEGWSTLKYNNRFEFLGETCDVKWELGIVNYNQYYFESYSWTTDASGFSDGIFECAAYTISDLADEEIKGYNLYERNS